MITSITKRTDELEGELDVLERKSRGYKDTSPFTTRAGLRPYGTSQVESGVEDAQKNTKTVGAFVASGINDVDTFISPKQLPIQPASAPVVSPTTKYMDRAASGINSYDPQVAAAPIVNASAERDANFARYGTGLPTKADFDAENKSESEKTAGSVYKRRMEERLKSVNYNPSSTL